MSNLGRALCWLAISAAALSAGFAGIDLRLLAVLACAPAAMNVAAMLRAPVRRA